jgi:hypothetical protein
MHRGMTQNGPLVRGASKRKRYKACFEAEAVGYLEEVPGKRPGTLKV